MVTRPASGSTPPTTAPTSVPPAPASAGAALPRGVDPDELVHRLDGARDRFFATGVDDALRGVVAESWARSLAHGLDPDRTLARLLLDDEALREIRATHPLTLVMPVVRRLLVESATDAGLLVAVSDAAGQLLYVEGDRALRAQAEAMHFVPGADWSEASVGTNAPGTALALDRPVQILGPEHLSRQVTPWSCSAAPIHDPESGAILGVLDVTGGPEVVSAQALSLVRATAAAAEAELRIGRLEARAPRSTYAEGFTVEPRLEVLGKQSAVLRTGQATSRLSLRHSEILLLLAEAHDGLSAGDLAVALSDDDHASVTVRAEMSRLRALAPGLELASRPYRLVSPIRSDLARVRDALEAGALRDAVSAYPGPVLPGSTAPGVEALRTSLHIRVRSALLAGADADALLTFADTVHGRDDYELWERGLAILPDGSPRRSQVVAHLAALDAELA